MPSTGPALLHRPTLRSRPSASTHVNANWKRFYLIIFFFLPLVHAHAQSLDPNRRISQYGHTAWRTQEGLVGADSVLAQTADGYMWIWSNGHFLRFDGAQLLPWQPPKDFKWPGQTVTYLFGSRDGSLWIGTAGGLVRLKDGQLSTYSDGGISQIIQDKSGKIWLTRYNIPKNDEALCEVDGSHLHCYGASDGLPMQGAIAVTEDPTGMLWIVSENLSSWKPGSQARPWLNTMKHPQILALETDHSGDVWATMDGAGPKFGVGYIHNGVWSEYSVPGFRSSTLLPAAIFVDRAGTVWVGTETDGLYRLSGNTFDHFSKSDGLSGRREIGRAHV